MVAFGSGFVVSIALNLIAGIVIAVETGFMMSRIWLQRRVSCGPEEGEKCHESLI